MRKQIIKKIIDEKPEAVLVKNKYKVIVNMIKQMFPNNYEKISFDIWEKIAFEIIQADRDWRKLTEGKDEPNKTILSQQWILDNIINSHE